MFYPFFPTCLDFKGHTPHQQEKSPNAPNITYLLKNRAFEAHSPCKKPNKIKMIDDFLPWLERLDDGDISTTQGNPRQTLLSSPIKVTVSKKSISPYSFQSPSFPNHCDDLSQLRSPIVATTSVTKTLVDVHCLVFYLTKWRKRCKMYRLLKRRIERAEFVQSLSWRQFLASQMLVSRWKVRHSSRLAQKRMAEIARTKVCFHLTNQCRTALQHWRMRVINRTCTKRATWKCWKLLFFLSRLSRHIRRMLILDGFKTWRRRSRWSRILTQRPQVLQKWGLVTWNHHAILIANIKISSLSARRLQLRKAFKLFLDCTCEERIQNANLKVLFLKSQQHFEITCKKMAWCSLTELKCCKENRSISIRLQLFRRNVVITAAMKAWKEWLHISHASKRINSIASTYLPFRNLHMALSSLKSRRGKALLRLGTHGYQYSRRRDGYLRWKQFCRVGIRHRQSMATTICSLLSRGFQAWQQSKGRVLQLQSYTLKIQRFNKRVGWQGWVRCMDRLGWSRECFRSASLHRSRLLQAHVLRRLGYLVRKSMETRFVVSFSLRRLALRRWVSNVTTSVLARTSLQRAELRRLVRTAGTSFSRWICWARRRIIVRRCFRVFRKLHPVPRCSAVRAVLCAWRYEFIPKQQQLNAAFVTVRSTRKLRQKEEIFDTWEQEIHAANISLVMHRHLWARWRRLTNLRSADWHRLQELVEAAYNRLSQRWRRRKGTRGGPRHSILADSLDTDDSGWPQLVSGLSVFIARTAVVSATEKMFARLCFLHRIVRMWRVLAVAARNFMWEQRQKQFAAAEAAAAVSHQILGERVVNQRSALESSPFYLRRRMCLYLTLHFLYL